METIELLQILDDTLDFFENRSASKYKLLKEEIEHKISILKNFIYFEFPVLNYSNKEQLDIFYYLKYNSSINDVNNMIDNIIYNIYESSGYQLLLSNIPTTSFTIKGEKIDVVTPETVNDTLELFVGEDNIESVFQVSSNIYIVKFQLDNDAKLISKLINNNMIENNIIEAKYIVQIENFKDSTYMDESMIFIESESDKYEKEFKYIEFKDIDIKDMEMSNIINNENQNENQNETSNFNSSSEQIPIPSSFLEKPRQNIEINKGFKGAEAPLAEAPLVDNGWDVYERKSLIGTLFNNIVNSISNTFSKYFSK
jgi:hypothetical protein